MAELEALDLSVIRYSRVDEDHKIISRGLRINPDQDVVLSITRLGLLTSFPIIYSGIN